MFTAFRSLPTARLLALTAFFGQLYFFVPVMTPYLLQRSLSVAEIAGLQTTLLVSLLVMEIPTGLIADRFGHVWSYRLSLIVLASGEFLFLFARDYPFFLLIQIITGTGFALGSGSVDAVLYDSLPPGDRTRAMQKAKGVLGAAAQTGSVVAYSVGGVIAADLTVPRMMITIAMGAIAVSTAAALSFGLRHAPLAHHHGRPRSGRLLATAWSAIRRTPELRRLLLLAIATNAFGAHLLVFYQQYFLETGVDGVWFGLALSVASVLVVLGQLHAWRLPVILGNRRSLALTTGLPGLVYLAMAWNQHPALAVALFVTQWGAIHVSIPLFSGLYNAHLPDDARATGLSLISAIVTIYIGIGGVILGWAAERSLPAMFAALGVVILAGAIGIRVDDRRANDTVPPTSASLP